VSGAGDHDFTLDAGHGRIVAVAVVDPDDAALAELHPDEREVAGRLAPVRRREWVAGRRALHRGLGGAADPILIDERGAPRMPAATVGSVSHKRDLAVALIAPDHGWTVGVDLELDRPRRVDIARKVLTPGELAATAALDAEARAREVLLRFALKEAVYKAIDPHLRRYVGFLEVAVWPAPDGSARVEPVSDWGLAIEAAWYRRRDRFLCTARARRCR